MRIVYVDFLFLRVPVFHVADLPIMRAGTQGSYELTRWIGVKDFYEPSEIPDLMNFMFNAVKSIFTDHSHN